jgi:tRNA U38,U39,U40 pseudouridine synthase TruA
VTEVQLLDDLTLRFVGEGFARYMVRMLVGGLLAVSHRELSLELFREGLENQRNFHCPTAPPQPLTLYSVGYPAEVDPFGASDREGLSSWPLASSRGAAGLLLSP